MSLRPAKCYRTVKRPFTRQSRRKPKKGYAKGVPASKITKFEIGNPKKNYPLSAELVSNNLVQIRHNALEAARISVNKYLTKMLGEEYFLKVLVFPHHILRENPTATGAGADRFQTGMRLSYGRPIGTAAQVKVGQSIILVKVASDKKAVAKEALRRASSKIPTTSHVVYNQ